MVRTLTLVLSAAAIASSVPGCSKPDTIEVRRITATPNPTVGTPTPSPRPVTPRPVVTPARTHARPDAAPRSDGGVIAEGIASEYGYPPCGSNGAAMLFYTWGHPYVRVIVSHAGRSVVATVCDNGPHVAGRVIDLSPSLFAALCPSCDGLIPDVIVRRAS